MSADTHTVTGQHLSWTVADTIVEVTLHRAPANEIGLETLAELEQLVAFINDGAGGARALIWTSSVKAGFCAGADLRALYHEWVAHEASGRSEAEAIGRVRSFLDRIHAVMNALDMAPLTTIAATHGVVFGGGFELALTADVIVADKSTRFAFPELRLGLIPGWGGIPRLSRDVGNAVVRDILLTGRSVGARRAHAVGLVSQLVGRGQALDCARQVAAQATRFDPRTSRVAKRFTKHLPLARLEEEKDIFCELVASPVVREALARFVNDDGPMPYLPAASAKA